jgi:hypothetical protein
MNSIMLFGALAAAALWLVAQAANAAKMNASRVRVPVRRTIRAQRRPR